VPRHLSPKEHQQRHGWPKDTVYKLYDEDKDVNVLAGPASLPAEHASHASSKPTPSPAKNILLRIVIRADLQIVESLAL
jgi:cellulase/cellobiase CelA1